MVLDLPGAVAGYSHDLCNALVERGSDVHLFSSPAWTRTAGLCRTREYQIHLAFGRSAWSRVGEASTPLGRGFWRLVACLGYLWTLLRLLLATRRFDVIHAQWAPVPLMDALWLRLVGSRKTVVATVHQALPAKADPERWRRWSFRTLFRSCDLVFAPSRQVVRRLILDYEMDPERVALTRHGCASYLRNLAERAPSCPIAHDGTPVVLFLGSIRRFSGVDVLLEAANLLRRAVWGFRVVVAGSPRTDMSVYEDLVRDLGLERMVDFRLGPVGAAKIPAYLRQSAVVVLPYRKEEPTDLAFAACTFGKPIVVSRIGGLDEVVDEAANGISFEPGDAPSLAEAIAKILRDDALRRCYETNSLVYARTDLSWRRIAGDTVAAYRRAGRRGMTGASV